MVAGLDVFSVRNSEAMWLGCADSLIEALALIQERGKGDYFLFSETKQERNYYQVAADGKISPVDACE